MSCKQRSRHDGIISHGSIGQSGWAKTGVDVNRFAIGHSRSRTKQKLEQIYATACRWLDVEPDDDFVETVLQDEKATPDSDLGSLLISRLLTEKLAMPSAAFGLIGTGLLHAAMTAGDKANDDGSADDGGITISSDEACDLDGLAQRLLLPNADPEDVRRAAAFVRFLLASHGSEALVAFGRAMRPGHSVDQASKAATGNSSAVLELEWQGTISVQNAKTGPWHVLLWTAKSARRFPRLLTYFFIGNAIQISYSVIVPVWLQHLFDEGIQQNHIGVIELMLTYLVVGFLLTTAAGVLLDYCIAALGPKMLERMRFRMFNKLQQMSARSLSRYGSDEVVTNFSNDLTVLEKAVVWSVPGLFGKSLMLVGSVGVAFHLDWQLAFADDDRHVPGVLASTPYRKMGVKEVPRTWDRRRQARSCGQGKRTLTACHSRVRVKFNPGEQVQIPT